MSAILLDTNRSFRDFLLYVAIRKSSEMASCYENLSRSMKQKELKTFFNEMAQVKHEEVSYYETNFGLAHRMFFQEEEQPACSPITAPLSLNNIEAACRFASTLEIIHFRFFARLAELESDAEVEELFLFVLRMHKMSLQFLESQLLLCGVSPYSKDAV